MNVHLVQLEPLNERYSDWWSTYLPKAFASFGNSVNVIKGDGEYKDVQHGTVLDAYGSNFYKATQLDKVISALKDGTINDGDKIFVADIWFPGIETIAYIRDIAQRKVKMFGVWHAGSITIEDFMEPSNEWAKYFELGFFKIFDGIFVGSDYSREAVLYKLLPYMGNEEASEIAKKIHAFGLPMNFDHIDRINKKNIPKQPVILFPSRFDIEKRPNVFMDLIEALAIKLDDYFYKEPLVFRFCTGRSSIKTNEPWLIDKYNFLKAWSESHPYIKLDFKYGLSKEEYYTELAQATCVVSATVDETFGYCVAEALAVGTNVVVPDAFCYPEILEGREEFMYNSFEELLSIVRRHISKWKETGYEEDPKLPEELKKLVEPYKNTVHYWNNVMLTT